MHRASARASRIRSHDCKEAQLNAIARRQSIRGSRVSLTYKTVITGDPTRISLSTSPHSLVKHLCPQWQRHAAVTPIAWKMNTEGHEMESRSSMGKDDDPEFVPKFLSNRSRTGSVLQAVRAAVSSRVASPPEDPRIESDGKFDTGSINPLFFTLRG